MPKKDRDTNLVRMTGLEEVSLLPDGANGPAEVALFKAEAGGGDGGNRQSAGPEGAAEAGAVPGLLKNMTERLASMARAVGLAKEARTFDELNAGQEVFEASEEILDGVWNFTQALVEGMDDLGEDQDALEVLRTNLEQFSTWLEDGLPEWSAGRTVTKSEGGNMPDKAKETEVVLADLSPEELIARVEAQQEEIDALKADPVEEPTEKTEEDVVKGLPPEAQEIFRTMQTTINEQGESVGKLTETVQRQAEATELGEILEVVTKEASHLPRESAKIAELVQKVRNRLGAEDETFLMELLKAGSVAVETSRLLNEVGHGQPAAGSAVEEILAKAQELADSEGITLAKAQEKVLSGDRELQARYTEEVKR